MTIPWDTVKLGDICAVKGGKRLPAGDVLVDWRTQHPYIKARDIRHGKVSSDDLQFVQPATFEKIRRYTVRQGDVCITIVANIGDVGIVPKDLDGASLTENAVKLTDFRKDVDSRFLALQLAHKQFKGFMELLAAGAAQSKLGIYKVKIIKVRLPSRTIQAKIAAVLSSYDELIENNNRRITLLNKLADEIYREWFVRLRFPGHQHSKFEKGFPADWEIKRVREVVARKRFGNIYRETDLSSDGQVMVIDQSREDYLGFYDGEPQHLASADNPIILFGDHTCKTVFMTKPFSLAENVIPFVAVRNISPYFLFHLVKDSTKTTEYKRHWTDLANREVLIPAENTQTAFENIVKEIHKQIELLRAAIRAAQQLRDLLVPRLLCGQLSVENLDIQFPLGMAENIPAEQMATVHA